MSWNVRERPWLPSKRRVDRVVFLFCQISWFSFLSILMLNLVDSENISPSWIFLNDNVQYRRYSYWLWDITCHCLSSWRWIFQPFPRILSLRKTIRFSRHNFVSFLHFPAHFSLSDSLLFSKCNRISNVRKFTICRSSQIHGLPQLYRCTFWHNMAKPLKNVSSIFFWSIWFFRFG
jgi:hypothetical protein